MHHVKTLRTLPDGEEMRLYARLIGAHTSTWRRVGAVIVSNTTPTATFDGDGRLCDPAWDRAQNTRVLASGDTIQFGVCVVPGRVVVIAECGLTGAIVAESRRIARVLGDARPPRKTSMRGGGPSSLRSYWPVG